MTKEYIEKKHVVRKKYVTRVTCDRCGQEVRKKDMFDDFSFTLRVRTGDSFPTGGSGVERGISDLCKPCALELIRQLNQAGYTTYEEEYEW